MRKLEKLLTEARKEVIEPLRNSQEMSPEELMKKKEEFAMGLDEAFEAEERVTDDDIYVYPVEVAYLLCSYQIELKDAIEDKDKILEYNDFYLENYPEIKFNGDIIQFYNTVKGIK